MDGDAAGAVDAGRQADRAIDPSSVASGDTFSRKGRRKYGDWARCIPGVREIEPSEIKDFQLLRASE
jgi:hypothetical protein